MLAGEISLLVSSRKMSIFTTYAFDLYHQRQPSKKKIEAFAVDSILSPDLSVGIQNVGIALSLALKRMILAQIVIFLSLLLLLLLLFLWLLLL